MGGATLGVTPASASRTSASPHRFGKQMRLRKRREFLAVQEAGKKFHGRHFLVVMAPGALSEHNTGIGRVGITVTKKIGNAVTRNRIKRLVREYFRQNPWIPAGMDAVVIAKHSAAELDGYAAVAADLSRIRARMSTTPEASSR